MSNNRKPQSIFPAFPREKPAVDKDGNLTQLWELGLSSLFQALQTNFKNEGIVFPWLTQDQLTAIESLYATTVGHPYADLTLKLPDISGQTVFDSTNRVPKQFIIKISGSPLNVDSASWMTFTLT